jgi:hypothetical protein
VFKDERADDRLSRIWYWKGPAWYQREVVIPESWKGKRITLLLERLVALHAGRDLPGVPIFGKPKCDDFQ